VLGERLLELGLELRGDAEDGVDEDCGVGSDCLAILLLLKA